MTWWCRQKKNLCNVRLCSAQLKYFISGFTAWNLALKSPCWFHTQFDISQPGAGPSFLPVISHFFCCFMAGWRSTRWLKDIERRAEIVNAPAHLLYFLYLVHFSQVALSHILLPLAFPHPPPPPPPTFLPLLHQAPGFLLAKQARGDDRRGGGQVRTRQHVCVFVVNTVCFVSD